MQIIPINPHQSPSYGGFHKQGYPVSDHLFRTMGFLFPFMIHIQRFKGGTFLEKKHEKPNPHRLATRGAHTSGALASHHRLATRGLDFIGTSTAAMEAHTEPSQTCHRNLRAVVGPLETSHPTRCVGQPSSESRSLGEQNSDKTRVDQGDTSIVHGIFINQQTQLGGHHLAGILQVWLCGGFPEQGYPKSWMLCNGKSHLEMDENQGPILGNPHI